MFSGLGNFPDLNSTFAQLSNFSLDALQTEAPADKPNDGTTVPIAPIKESSEIVKKDVPISVILYFFVNRYQLQVIDFFPIIGRLFIQRNSTGKFVQPV